MVVYVCTVKEKACSPSFHMFPHHNADKASCFWYAIFGERVYRTQTSKDGSPCLGRHSCLCCLFHISIFMSEKSKNAINICLETNSYFLLMFKVGGVNSPQLQFLTTCVCGQQIDIDTDFLLCTIQQQT